MRNVVVVIVAAAGASLVLALALASAFAFVFVAFAECNMYDYHTCTVVVEEGAAEVVVVRTCGTHGTQ